MRLENKVALISGGARGIGAAVAKIFAQEGAKIVIGDILEEEGRRTASDVTEAGGECFFVKLDVTSESDWEQAAGEAVSRFGRLDILVNNAGISARGNIEETSEAVWTRTMDVNVKGAFLGSKQAIPIMRTGGGGSIINISSGAGIAPQPGTSGAYAASKGAVRLFSKSTAIQYANENIRCNSVHPILDHGELHRLFQIDLRQQRRKESLVLRCPQHANHVNGCRAALQRADVETSVQEGVGGHQCGRVKRLLGAHSSENEGKRKCNSDEHGRRPTITSMP